MHVLTTQEGENEGFDAPVKKREYDYYGVRGFLVLVGGNMRIMTDVAVGHRLYDAGLLLRYGLWHPARKRRQPVKDIDALIALWVNSIAGVATAHTPEQHDQADFNADELLSPLLTAPVKQLREFAAKLVTALENDERIPYIVWRPFSELIRYATEKATNERVMELKEGIAREVALMVEAEVQPQLVDAMTNALKWRSRETLTAIKTAVTSGEKPKLTGRQSCLFLEAGGKRVML